jgi:hypothetical protein
MTGDEIIALARANFGESSPLTVSVQTAKDFLNAALQELYNDLPPERMKNRLTESVVVMTANQGPVENTWDRIIEVYVDDVPALQVPKDVIPNADHNSMFSPPVAIFHVDDKYVWVRPSGAVKIVHVEPPGIIANFSSEVSVFSELWHSALALLTTSYMYAQEEDVTQAQHYRGEYSQTIASLIQQMEVEAE